MFTPRSYSNEDIAMVRAGEKAHLHGICRDCGVVTIGWFHTPPRDMTEWGPEDLERYMALDYPVGDLHIHRDMTSSVWSKAKVTKDINQIGDFLFNMNPGRLVTVAAPGLSALLIGEVTKRYDFKGGIQHGVVKDPYLHFKPVKWLAQLDREDMSQELVKYILNHRYQTVFWYKDRQLLDELNDAVR